MAEDALTFKRLNPSAITRREFHESDLHERRWMASQSAGHISRRARRVLGASVLSCVVPGE